MFFVAVAAGAKAVVINNGVPEKDSEGITIAGAGYFILPGKAQQLGDVRVSVFGIEYVFPLFEWIECFVVVKEFGEPFVFGLARDGVEVVKRFVDATKLIA